MSTISVSLPADGSTGTVAQYNTPITTIVNAINGSLDNSNIASGAAIATAKLADDAGITGAKIATNAIKAANIDTAAITLGYAQITANPSNVTTSLAQVTGLSATVTIPSGGRKVEITAYIPYAQAGATLALGISIWDGTVGSGTQLQVQDYTIQTSGYAGFYVSAIVTPSAGSKTYNVGAQTSTNAATINAATTYPAYILVKAI